MRIVVDRAKGMGLGRCEAEAPDLFEVPDGGSMVVLAERPAEDRRDALEAEGESCPAAALAIAED